MNNFLCLFLLPHILFTAVRAAAQEDEACYHNAVFRNEIDFFQTLKILDYKNNPWRRIVSALPKEEQVKYVATGSLICNGQKGSASLTTIKGATGVRNIVTTVGHVIFDPKTCRRAATPRQCFFHVMSRGRMRAIQVDDVVKNGLGLKCPQPPPAKMVPLDPWNDWAVMRLSESVEDVIPYEVDLQTVKGIKNKSKVKAVGHSDDKTLPGKGEDGFRINMPKHMAECGMEDVSAEFSVPYLFSTSCGCSHGCSGGSLVTSDANDRPQLLGVITGMTTTISPDGQPVNWERDKYETLVVPFTGDFYSALRNSVGL